MVRQDENIEVCHAHSGVLTQIKIGGAIIGGLMLIFIGILSVMWTEQKKSTEAILSQVRCLAPANELDVIKKKVDDIRDEQMRLKWTIEQQGRK